MNDGKIGRPYCYPESFVQFTALWCEFFNLPYRQLEGALRKLGELIPELRASDYTNLWHRSKGLELEIPESEDKVVAAVDTTGIKVTNRGEWLRKYHKGKRRGWIKVHVAVDAESKELLSIEVTDEKTDGSEIFEELVENLDLKDCLAHGAYDSEEIFKILEERGWIYRPGSSFGKNAKTGFSPKAKPPRSFRSSVTRTVRRNTITASDGRSRDFSPQ